MNFPITPTPATAENLASTTAAFARAHRAVRRGILLAQSLDAPAEAKPTRTATRARVIRAIEDQVGDKTDPPAAERLHAESRERLDSPDFEADLLTRPPDAIITDIVRDLGLQSLSSNGFKRRTPADPAFAPIWPPRRKTDDLNELPRPPGHPQPHPLPQQTSAPSPSPACGRGPG